MSKNDPLKSIFDKSFANEHIQFDPAGWDQMESMLDAQPKKRTGFLWLFGGLSVIAGVILFALLNQGPEIYIPRTASVDYSEIPVNKLDMPSPAVSEASSNVNVDSKASNASANQINHANSSNSELTPSNGSEGIEIAVNEPNQLNENTIAEREEIPSETESSDTSGEIDINSDGNESQSLPVIAAASESESIKNAPRIDLNTMDLIYPEFSQEADVLDRSSDENQVQKRTRIMPYLRAGITNNSFSGDPGAFDAFGQLAGFGVEYQLMPHFLITSEINLYREQTNLAFTQQFTQHSYYELTQSQVFEVSELLSSELPIMLHYRMNRWRFATGFSLQYFISSKINETIVTESEAVDFTANEETRYDDFARWDQLSTFSFNIPIEVNYQLNDRYFIGARYRQGLNDLFMINSRVDRKSALEFYIRMNLRP